MHTLFYPIQHYLLLPYSYPSHSMSCSHILPIPFTPYPALSQPPLHTLTPTFALFHTNHSNPTLPTTSQPSPLLLTLPYPTLSHPFPTISTISTITTLSHYLHYHYYSITLSSHTRSSLTLLLLSTTTTTVSNTTTLTNPIQCTPLLPSHLHHHHHYYYYYYYSLLPYPTLPCSILHSQILPYPTQPSHNPSITNTTAHYSLSHTPSITTHISTTTDSLLTHIITNTHSLTHSHTHSHTDSPFLAVCRLKSYPV